jgi:hypothetical protein
LIVSKVANIVAVFNIETYSDEERRNGRKYCKNKRQRNHLGRALRVVSEDVTDEWLLAVSQRCLVWGRRDVRVELDVEVEDGHERGLGRAK